MTYPSMDLFFNGWQHTRGEGEDEPVKIKKGGVGLMVMSCSRVCKLHLKKGWSLYAVRARSPFPNNELCKIRYVLRLKSLALIHMVFSNFEYSQGLPRLMSEAFDLL